MGRGRSVVVTQSADRKVISVRGWQVGDLLREAGMKPIYSRPARGYVLDARHLPDVVALCEWQSIGVRVVERREAG